MRPTSGNDGRPSGASTGGPWDTNTSKLAATLASTARSRSGDEAFGFRTAEVMHCAAQPVGPPVVTASPRSGGGGSGVANPALVAVTSTYWLKPGSLTLILKAMASV